MKKYLSIVLCLVLVTGMFAGCSKEVTVDTAGLEHITIAGAATAIVKEGYIANLTAETGYMLPETITVTMEGQEGDSFYTYDPASGNLSIDEVTGNISISGTALESILGTWEGTIDIAQRLNDMLASDPNVAGFFSLSGFSLDVTVTFSDDGTCTLATDRASATAAMEQALKQMSDSLLSVLLQQLTAAGASISLEEYLASSGTSLDSLLSKFFPESMAGSFKNLDFEAAYEIRDGKLYLTDEAETAHDYTLNANTLTIQAPADAADQLVFPLQLQRVN